ncbi:double-strand break repair protein AddB [Oceanicella actignis]|uniref:Double-strand break repair protein AddB n=1 Tax=Oceanicella actignis TaxID=1189325 RepID=A0A1M7U0X9_9RHOB|nr:double-strand break repair protein AddB [Oceanicella actignis]SET85604.1 PD-(D/E)XK nuclease superfamily protein [Oceanicella actignis]SHN76666.1 double-strand break repair protein AddB [Oceanicella actignis]
MSAPAAPALFPPAQGPRVFHLPPGVDFAAAFARGLRARLAPHPPQAAARVRIFVNARRTARAIEAALEAEAPALWMPRFAFVNALGDEALGLGVPRAVDPLRRRLALVRLVEGFMRANPEFGDPASAPALAETLGALLDDLHGAGLTAEALAALDPAEHARHWDLTRRFLHIVTAIWPRHLAEAEGGAADPQARRLAAARALARSWREDPPPWPMIAAGSTGSTPATAELIAAVAQLPQGAAVLPGLDPELPDDLWRRIADEHPEHPQHMLARLCLDRLGVSPRESRPWSDAPAPCPPRARLLAQALRPAPVTDAWFAARPALAAEAAEAVAGVDLIEADGPRQEAAAIALALADAARAGRRAALVTPDRVLARRVAAELARHGIAPDDSAGVPLSLTPPGIFLDLLARSLGRPMRAATLAALLRHPLAGGPARGRHAHMRRWLERAFLRGGPVEIDWPALTRAAETLAQAARARAEAGEDRPRAGATGPEHLRWLAWLRGALEPLSAQPASLAAAVAAHRAAAEALAAGPPDEGAAPDPAAGAPDGAPPDLAAAGHAPPGAAAGGLWDQAAGEAARALIESLAAAADAYDGAQGAAPGGYGALFSALAAAREVRLDPRRADDRVAIRGTLEARAQSADLVVLGGLNDGVWPARPDPGPWLGRPQRRELGLPAPEARIGLAAHDFLQAACAPRVILSRAIRADGAPTVASRWLLRLTNLLGGVDEGALAAMRARGARWLARAEALSRAEPLAPAERPAPRPPVAARPRRLSVTQIETLVRDPYAIYARKILGLEPLEPLGRAPDARDMGQTLHRVMERFALETGADADLSDSGRPDAGWTEAALAEALIRIAREEVAEQPSAGVRRLWLKRLERAAPALARFERERRARGLRLARAEGWGRAAFDAPAGRFELFGRADRIDRGPDGALSILDYKTGALPGKNEITVFAKQLLLLGAIARAGGFEDVPAAEAHELLYVRLSEKLERREAPPDQIDDAWRGLRELIAAYDDPATPYRPRLRPRSIKHAGDYDHLARLGEWGDVDADDAGDGP